MKAIFFGIDRLKLTNVSAPYINSIIPGNGDIEVPFNTNTYIEIYDDDGMGINKSTIKVYIKTSISGVFELAYDGSTDTFQAGFDGPNSDITQVNMGMGYNITVDWTCATDAMIVDVNVYCKDSSPLELDLDYFYQYKMKDDPYVYFLNPNNGDKNVDSKTYIEIGVTDDSSGVDGAQTDIYINSVLGMSNGVFQAGFEGNITPVGQGFLYSIKPSAGLPKGVNNSIRIYAEDLYGNFVDYTYGFETIGATEAKTCILTNSLLENVLNTSSDFKAVVKEVSAGSLGNVALSVTADPNAIVGQSYTVQIKKSGRLDTELQNVVEKSVELGTGQIIYSTVERIYKGNYDPPSYTIHDGSNYYGSEQTCSKLVFAKKTSAGVGFNLRLCDRNDESFFCVRNSTLYSIPKFGQTDSNPVNGVEISSFSIRSITKIGDNRFLICGYSTDVDRISFKILDEDANIIETLNDWLPFGEYSLTNYFTIENSDIYFDGKRTIYLTFVKSTQAFALYHVRRGEIYFAKSINGGKSWELVKYIDTNNFVVLKNFLAEEEGLQADTTNNIMLMPRLIYDEINEFFILSVGVRRGTSDLYRVMNCYSKDFVNWSRLNYPFFSRVAIGDDHDLQTDAGGTSGTDNVADFQCTPMVRMGSKYFMIGGDLNGVYASIFENESQKYGNRRSLIWKEHISTAHKGSRISFCDLKVFDGVMYFGAISRGPIKGIVSGFSVHALDVPTNVPDKSPYVCAYIGSTGLASSFGFTRADSGGGFTEDFDDDGMVLTATSTNHVFYYEDNFKALYNFSEGFKCKFTINPVTTKKAAYSAFYASLNTTGSKGVEFRIEIYNHNTNTIISIYDIAAGSYIGTDITAPWVGKFVDILVAVKFDAPGSDAGQVTVFAKEYNSNEFDTWTHKIYSLLDDAGAVTDEIRFGLLSDGNTDSREVYFKSVYIADISDEASDFYWNNEDNLADHDFNSSTDSKNLVPISMLPEGITQKTINNLNFKWYGLDAFTNDDWTFKIDSVFPASFIFNKSPKLYWMSSVGSAVSGTSEDQYIILDAELDGIDKYIFNAVTFFNTNFKFVKIQANDTNSWGSPSFDEIIDFTIIDGFVTEEVHRQNNDTFVVKDSFKNWMIDELKDKYVVFENIIESDTPTTYGNVAFKILNNGTNYFVISTKSLSGTNVKINSNTVYNIYETKKVFTTDISIFRYVRILIPVSASFVTAWNTANQPNLPDEKCWRIGEIDLGVRTDIEDIYSQYNEEYQSNSVFVEEDDGRINTGQNGPNNTRLTISYNLLTEEQLELLITTFRAVENSDKPFWFFPQAKKYPHKVYLVNFVDMEYFRNIPDHYDVKIVLEEVS